MSKTEFAEAIEVARCMSMSNVAALDGMSDVLLRALRIADKLMKDTSTTGRIVRDAMLKEIDG